MTTYIDIDLTRQRLNGQAATLTELAAKVHEVKAQPGLYLCLLRNDYSGQYRYADFASTGTGDSADHSQ